MNRHREKAEVHGNFPKAFLLIAACRTWLLATSMATWRDIVLVWVLWNDGPLRVVEQERENKADNGHIAYHGLKRL
jgi:hypothetical protein